jgi:energy-coupling factor transporter ATP-binding protein EcfA2
VTWGWLKNGIAVLFVAGSYVVGQLVGHPLTILLVGVICALGTAIAKDLWKRWQERIVEHTDKAVVRMVSGFGHRYRAFVLNNLRFVETKGLATIGPYAPELDEVFVDVSLAYRAPHQVPEGVLAEVPPEVIERHTIWDFVRQSTPQILAIVGVPGSGKTTLLRHTARHMCRERHGRRRTVPLLLYLRDHATTIAGNPEVTLPQLVREQLAQYRVHEPDGWFEKRLQSGCCLVLLDGLDEVGQLADRINVSAWVERQTKQYRLSDFIITSRPQGYRTAPIEGATVLQVRSFTNQQVRTLVNSWYQAVERRWTGASGPDVQMRADVEAADLLDRLNTAPGLYDLTVNPLLLTMITNVHRFRGALPGSRVDLYGEMCQVMLWRRQEAKKLPTELSGEKKEALLRGLAFKMMERKVRDLPRAEVLAEIEPALRRMSTQLTAEAYLSDVGSNGLLVERESGLFSFAHLTFQEYLAACYIRERGIGHILASTVGDVWWRETTILYAARSNADPIVSACLIAATVTSLSLAFDCADEASEIDPVIRGQLDELLASASLAESHRERRRLVSRIVVARYLRHMSRATSGGRVCVRPVPASIYNLFRRETGRPSADGPYSSRTDPNAPATGMHGSDASTFVGWVNSITSGNPGCRLPYGRELDDPVVAHARAVVAPPAPTWLETEDARHLPRLWIPAGTPHPHLVTDAQLAEHLSRDFQQTAPIVTRVLLLHSLLRSMYLGGYRIRASNGVVDYFDLFADLNSHLSRTFDLVLEYMFESESRERYDADLALQHQSMLQALNIAQILSQADNTDPNCRQYVEFALRTAQKLSTSLIPIPDLGLIRALDHIIDLDRSRIPRSVAQADGVSATDVVGVALARTVERLLLEVPSVDWCTTLTREFLAATGCASWSQVIVLDELPKKLLAGQHELRLLIGATSAEVHIAWPVQVAGQLADYAGPVFAREQPITTDQATVIRVAALCLAAEADADSASDLGDTFREIAAGATLLERRMSGKASAAETILLASE